MPRGRLQARKPGGASLNTIGGPFNLRNIVTNKRRQLTGNRRLDRKSMQRCHPQEIAPRETEAGRTGRHSGERKGSHRARQTLETLKRGNRWMRRGLTK